jgi:DNA-binding IclR family transcriptional regulator
VSERYINGAQQRLMKVLRALAGNELMGLAPSELAREVKGSASQITRDLANLKHMGWAEQLPDTARWRLGPELIQISLRHSLGMNRARARLEEVEIRYSRST